MVEFDQSPATRQAMQDAARAYLRSSAVVAALAGTSDKKSRAYRNAQRRVQRYTARAGQERRKASPAALAQVAGKLTMEFSGYLEIGGDPKYGRHRTGIQVDIDEALLQHAISEDDEDVDEAWQDFFDDYVIPAGIVERPKITFKQR